MEFIIQKDLFLNTLRIAEHVSSTKGIQIILSNVYIEAKENNEIIFKSSDLDLGVILKVEAQVKKAGKITLPSKKLSEIVSRLPEDEIKFELSEETGKVKLTSGRAKFELIGVNASEYPVIISEEEIESFTNSIKLDLETFINTIKKTVYASSPNDSNTIYNGVLLNITGKNMEMAATNGTRLSLSDEVIENKEEKDFEVIIPSRALLELVRFQAGMDEKDIEIYKKEGQMIFKIGENILISRTIGGRFPQYKQIIPKNNDKIVIVEREKLINAIDRISPMIDEKTGLIRLHFENKQLELVAKNEIGSCNDIVDVEFDEEEPLDIAFNYRFLQEALKNYDEEKVKFELKQTLAAALIKPFENEKYMALIMPINVKE